MRRAITYYSAGNWPGHKVVDSVTLDFDARYRRRMVLETDGGEKILLDLERAVPMAHNDGLALDDGSWIAVRSAPESVVEITATSRDELVRIGWHLGNRHLPTEITSEALYIRPDPVIEVMLRDIGAHLQLCQRAFQPERGAYGQKHNHARKHSHDH